MLVVTNGSGYLGEDTDALLLQELPLSEKGNRRVAAMHRAEYRDTSQAMTLSGRRCKTYLYAFKDAMKSVESPLCKDTSPAKGKPNLRISRHCDTDLQRPL